MTAENTPRDLRGKLKDAAESLSEYSYRKEFSLSFKEFIEEPLDVYLINGEIMSIISDIQRRQQKKLERDSQR